MLPLLLLLLLLMLWLLLKHHPVLVQGRGQQQQILTASSQQGCSHMQEGLPPTTTRSEHTGLLGFGKPRATDTAAAPQSPLLFAGRVRCVQQHTDAGCYYTYCTHVDAGWGQCGGGGGAGAMCVIIAHTSSFSVAPSQEAATDTRTD